MNITMIRKMNCHKCGSKNVSFNRETWGTYCSDCGYYHRGL